MSADWSTVASLATAGGTLVLAVATFSAVRSANRAALLAERMLLAGLRPLLLPSRLEDPPEKVVFGDGHWVLVQGGHAAVEPAEHAVYLTVAVRNAGNGIAVLHAWCYWPEEVGGDADHAPLARFRRQTRDMYVPAGGLGFWQGALREPADPHFERAREACAAGRVVVVELLYGDHEGGQRMITRFRLLPGRDGDRLAVVARHWTLDRPDPRSAV